MAKTFIRDGLVLYQGVDISGDTNQIDETLNAAAVDVTNLASAGWTEKLGSLKGGAWKFQGFRENNEPDASMFSLAQPVIVTTAPLKNPVSVGDVTYSMRGVRTRFSHLSKVGDAAGFQLDLESTLAVVRGQIMVAAGVTAITATGNGPDVAAGAVAASKSIYAFLHVLSLTGTSPTLDVTVQSDTTNAFGAPATRLTFAQVAGSGTYTAAVQTAAGAITDTHWRAHYVLGGTGSPGAKFVLAFAIQ